MARFDIFELKLEAAGATDPSLTATFRQGEKSFRVAAFWDGGTTYRIRFMPPTPGSWEYEAASSAPDGPTTRGSFICKPPPAATHGRVRVVRSFFFEYEDGTPFTPIGTTSYGWSYQSAAQRQKTLDTLRNAPFNKLRMCVLPTRYPSTRPPDLFPFEKVDGHFDTARIDVRYFQQLDASIAALRALNIEADLILFHPYDGGQMGFDRMSAQDDAAYVRYVAARYGAYRNVWWSMANEFDLVKTKSDSEWDRLFQVLQQADPFDHLRSIHFSQRMYDNAKPWITHASVQNGMAVDDFGRAVLFRQALNKPIVFDEMMYEGDLERRWGQLSAEDMTLRFWMAAIGGCFAGHGESYKRPDDNTWISSGGTLRGGSVARIAFLKQLLADAPELTPIDPFYDAQIAGKAGEYYLIYFGRQMPKSWPAVLPQQGLGGGDKFKADVIDTWNMTVAPVDGDLQFARKSAYLFEAGREIALPGRPYMAVRLRRVGPPTTAPTTGPSPD